jgi:hypothetical protein
VAGQQDAFVSAWFTKQAQQTNRSYGLVRVKASNLSPPPSVICHPSQTAEASEDPRDDDPDGWRSSLGPGPG